MAWTLPLALWLCAPLEARSLRYLAINVGNASPEFFCWEYKLCRPQDVQHLREYISAWKPDVIVMSEVYRAEQLTGTEVGGPILPSGYTGLCGQSVDRDTGQPAAWDADNASHEHECIAWKTSRLERVPGSELSAPGRNDDYGKSNCDYDFTAFRVRLVLDGRDTLTPIALHPDSQAADCRTEEIARYWSDLAQGEKVFLGGDWNTESPDEIQRPPPFQVNYSAGQHWSLALHSDEYSAIYLQGSVRRKLDHVFSNFGQPCTHCGINYGTADLPFGSALGSYDEHPRADAGSGFDHRQILVDIELDPLPAGQRPAAAFALAVLAGCVGLAVQRRSSRSSRGQAALRPVQRRYS